MSARRRCFDSHIHSRLTELCGGPPDEITGLVLTATRSRTDTTSIAEREPLISSDMTEDSDDGNNRAGHAIQSTICTPAQSVQMYRCSLFLGSRFDFLP